MNSKQQVRTLNLMHDKLIDAVCRVEESAKAARKLLVSQLDVIEDMIQAAENTRDTN